MSTSTQTWEFVHGGPQMEFFRRRVEDGELEAFVTQDPELGWIMRLRHRPSGVGRCARYPTWDEVTKARFELLPRRLEFMALVPDFEDDDHDVSISLYENPGP